jgi:hypothetical protein
VKQVWACSQCRSINDPRASRCYKCLTPRERAEVDPGSLSPTASADPAPVLDLPRYQPATIRAVIAASLIAVATGLEVLGTVNATLLAQQSIDRASELSEAQAQYLASMSVLGLAVALGAFVTFGLWLSKAVATVPALGLGYTRVSPRQALYEVLFPLGLLIASFALGLFALFLFSTEPAAAALAALISLIVAFAGYLALVRRVPAVIWDLMRRLDPASGRAGILIAGAWFGLVLGFLIPRVGAILVGVSDGLSGASSSLLMLHAVYLVQLATALYLVAGICLVGIIVWVETKTRAVARARTVARAPDVVLT